MRVCEKKPCFLSNAPLCWRIYFITQSKQRDPSNINTEKLLISSSVLQPGLAGSTEMALISAWALLGFLEGRVNQNERLRKLLSWHRLSASWCSLFKSPQRITLLKVFLLCCIRIHHWTPKKLLLVFVVSCKVLQIFLNSYLPSPGCPAWGSLEH